MRPPRFTLSYANIVATLALFVALGGTSYAVTKLPRNSVGTPQIRSGAVTLDKLAENARALRGPRGAAGPAGERGLAGERAPAEALVANASPVSLGNVGRTTVATLDRVPAGPYLLTGQVEVADFSSNAWIFRCGVYANGVSLVETHLVVGTSAGSVRAGTLSPVTTTTQPAQFRASLECFPDQSLSQPPGLTSGRLVAVRLGTLS